MKKTGLADSPFFKRLEPAQPQAVRPGEASPPLPPAQTERISERKSERTETRSENRTVAMPSKRRTRRYSFEFYEDQVIQVKRLKYEAEMAGQRVSLSDIVREALDQYLDKQ